LIYFTLLVLFSNAAMATVLTSIRPLAFIAAAIADGIVPVEVLLPSTASPHDYTLRPSDLRRLRTAELIVWVGPELESFLTQPLRSLTVPQLLLSQMAAIKPLLRVEGKLTKTDHGEHGQGGSSVTAPCCASHAGYDLHIWLSPMVARQIAQQIQITLLKSYPHYRTRLVANLTQFEQQLNQVESEIRSQLAPLSQRGYFVFHDAYRYFESYFGLQQRGHFTINPVLAPGAQRLQQIRRQLQQPGVICLFTEPQFKPRIIESIAHGTQAKLGTLDPLGSEIPVAKESYFCFLTQLTQQFSDCLQH
jgi:zinc transport system substrate-binding protein